MIKWVKIIFLLITIFSCTFSYAVIVPKLYSAKVPIASRSSRLFNQTLPLAMKMVLIKASGNGEIEANSTIKNALLRASQYLEEYSYSDVTNTADQQYILEASFVQQSVDALLQQAGIPIWSNDRPLTLVWMVVKDRSGQHLANDNAAFDTLNAIQLQAEQLGLPLLFPLLDLTDLGNVQPYDVWAPFKNIIQSASARYSFDDILIVREDISDASDITSHWTMVMNNDQSDWEVDGSDIVSVTTEGMRKVAGELSNRYTSAQNENEISQITMTINNLTSATAYSKVLKYLQNLTGVDKVEVKNVSLSDAEFLLTIKTDLKLLKRALSLNKILVPDLNQDEQEDQNSLYYRFNQ